MKGAVVAALHALAALARPRAARRGRAASRSPPRRTAASGTFAALERDARFDACLIPEPTGFDVVCAQAGALTFAGDGARASPPTPRTRLEGVSAIDRYLAVHAALAAHERALNARRRAPADARARAALPAPRRPHRGGRVVEQRARPARLRGPRRRARRRGRRPPRARRSRPPSRARGDGARRAALDRRRSSRPARRRRTTRSRGSCARRVGAELGARRASRGVP